MEKKTEEQIREEIREIDRLTRKRIRDAMDVFYRHPGEQTVYGALDQILLGYMFHTLCYVPAALAPDNSGFLMKTMYVPERAGDAYILYTGMKEAEDPTEIYIAIPYRTVIRHAAKDEGIVGIMVNPGRLHPNLFMSRQNISVIIRTGEEQISRDDPDFQKNMEKYRCNDIECGPGGRPLVG